MSKSPLSAGSNVLDLSIKVKGTELIHKYYIISVEVNQELNKIPTAEIVLQDGRPSTSAVKDQFLASNGSDFEPGNEVEIKAGFGPGNAKETMFKGIVVSQKIRVRDSGSSLVVTCRDKAIAMTVGRKSKYFLKKKDSQVMTEVIKESGVKATVKATTYEHPEIIQYYCTDWDFLLQRARVNGQVVIASEGTVDVAPPNFSAAAKVKLNFGVDLLEFDGEIDARTQYPKVSCSAWDLKTQKMVKGDAKEPTINKQGKLKGDKVAKDVGIKGPIEMHTSAPLDKKMLEEWANGSLLYSRLSLIRGKAKFRGSDQIKLGETLDLEGLGENFNGAAYISKVTHYLAKGNWTTTVNMGLPTWFSHGPEVSASEPAAGLLPPIHGLQTGVVKKLEADPGKEVRIQVDVPVIDPKGDGVWARIANFYATKEAGLFFLPEVGDEVVLGFMNDDPRFPVVLGMVYSSKIAAPYKIEKENKTKAIVTKSKMKLEFDDKDKIIVIETPGGNKVTISDKDKSVKIEDQNSNTLEMSDKGITLKSAKDVTIDATGKLNLMAKGKITIDSKQDVALAGLNIEGAAKVGMKMAGNAKAEFTASGQVMVKGAMVMIN